MARRAFAKPDILAEICGVPADLITGINNIWIAIRSSRQISPQKFDEYCKKVKQMYFSAGLNWYPMCPT